MMKKGWLYFLLCVISCIGILAMYIAQSEKKVDPIRINLVRSDPQIIPSAEYTPIDFDDSKLLIVPCDGIYSVDAQVYFDPEEKGIRITRINIDNGRSITDSRNAVLGGASTSVSLHGIVRLKSEDVIQVVVWQNSNRELNISANTAKLSLNRIGD